MNLKKLLKLEEKIFTNIEKDRGNSDKFLADAQSYLDNNPVTGEEYSKIMLAIAKVMENSQKSNEQFVKIFELYQKKMKIDDNMDLSKEDIEKIYGEVVESSE